MENGIDVAIKIARQQTLDELVFIEVVDDFAIDEIPELVRLGQVIYGDDLVNTALVERLDDV